jgi:broad specificity phosphatase PhoE
MATKLIYFVRHGQTENNAQNLKQGAGGHLSETGRDQALTTAKRFPMGPGLPQIIFSSPYERTKETAEIIAAELGIKIKYTDLLKERRNPSEVIGKWGGDPEVRSIMDRMDRSYRPDDFRISDEENFVDLKKRAKKLLSFISQRWEKRIIMVTHSNFLKLVAAYMIYGDKLTASEHANLSFFNPIKNAGMAIVKYTHHWFRKNEWELLVWNDLGNN